MSDIELIPYIEVNGIRTLTDDQVKAVYCQMAADGTLNTVFASGPIKSPAEFMSMMKSPTNLPVVLAISGRFAGIGWLNGLEDNHAMAHFCFYKEHWGRRSFDLGKKLLNYWMGFNLFDVLVGRIPSFNKRAIHFVERLGFRRVGEIPYLGKDLNGDRVSMSILYYSRDEHGQ